MKKIDIQSRFGFLLSLLVLLSSSYLIHSWVANKDLINTYFFNGIITIIAFLFLYKLQKKRPDIVGFSFMGLSAIKFVLFLVIFAPFTLEVELKRAIFLDFFIPYTICMVLEVYFLAKVLS